MSTSKLSKPSMLSTPSMLSSLSLLSTLSTMSTMISRGEHDEHAEHCCEEGSASSQHERDGGFKTLTMVGVLKPRRWFQDTDDGPDGVRQIDGERKRSGGRKNRGANTFLYQHSRFRRGQGPRAGVPCSHVHPHGAFTTLFRVWSPIFCPCVCLSVRQCDVPKAHQQKNI